MWKCACGDGKVVELDVEGLAKHSGYYRAILHSGMHETKNRVINMSLFTSQSITHLKQLFDNDSELLLIPRTKKWLTLEEIDDLFKVLDYLDMPGSYDVYSKSLTNVVPRYCSDTEQVLKLWSICVEHQLENVSKRLCTCVAIQVFDSDKSFHALLDFPFQLFTDVLEEIATSSEKDIKGMEIMQLIHSWIHHCEEERLTHFKTLFQYVSIPTMTKWEQCEIQNMVDSLGITDVDIIDMSCRYIANPHKFIRQYPVQAQLYERCEVIVAFSGLINDSPIDAFTEFDVRPACIPVNTLEATLQRKWQENTQPSTEVFRTSKLVKFNTLQNIEKIQRRIEFAICLCTPENFIYLFGGQRVYDIYGTDAMASGYRFDPYTGKWTEVAPMMKPRCLFGLASIWGQLYAIGGVNIYGVQDTTEVYIPEEDMWVEGPKLPNKLHEFPACEFNGKLYISGGHDDVSHSSKVWMLESVTGTWQSAAPMLEARSYHTMSTVGDRLFVFGGCGISFGQGYRDIVDVLTVEEYSSQTNTWTKVMTLDGPVCQVLPITVGQKVLFFGGYSFTADKEIKHLLAVDVQRKECRKFGVDLASMNGGFGYQCLKLSLPVKFLQRQLKRRKMREKNLTNKQSGTAMSSKR